MNSHESKQTESAPGMLRDLLNGVVRLAEGSLRAEMVNVQGMPSDIKAYHVPGEKEIKLLTLPQAATLHKPDGLDSFILVARQNPGSIWISADKVFLVFATEAGRADRREGAVIELRHSTQFKELLSLYKEDGQWFKQKELIHFLRAKMDAAKTGTSDQLLKAARDVRFRKHSESTSVIEHGKASIGKAIQLEASGCVDIPSEISFCIPVYQNEGCDHFGYIRVAVDVDAEEGAFCLLPIAGQCEAEIQNALQKIAEDVEKSLGQDVPIYFGKPW